MTNRSEIIDEAITEALVEEGLDPNNRYFRLEMMKGLREGWIADSDNSLEKSMFLTALNTMIFCAEIKTIVSY